MKNEKKLILSILTTITLYTGCGGGESDGSITNETNKTSYIDGSKTTTEKNAKAQLGVLSNATVRIYGLGNNSRKLLFTETTTMGKTIDDIGKFNAHENELLNDIYYLYEVNGGNDWDANDDGIVDETSTRNDGTFRAVLKGNTIKSLGGKITISAVSEILYTKVKNYIELPTTLEKKLEQTPSTILKNDLNADGKIDSKDIILYNPIKDKDKLVYFYKNKLNNILHDIHNGNKIDIAVKPTIKGSTFNITSQISRDMVIGSVDIIDDGQGRLSFEILGNQNIFDINRNGMITISHPENLSVKSYILKIYAKNSAGKSDIVDVTINVSASSDIQAPVIDIDSSIQKLEASEISVDFEINDALSITVELEGEDKDIFKVKKEYGDYTLTLQGDGDFENPIDSNEDNMYHVTIKATDGAGNIAKKAITLKINDDLDELPVLEYTIANFTKRDDIASDLAKNGDIFIGKVKVYYEGDSPIQSFTPNSTSSKYYSAIGNIFRVNNKGEVYLRSNLSYLAGFNDKDKNFAIDNRNNILNKFQTEGEEITFPVKAENLSRFSGYSTSKNRTYFYINITAKDKLDINPSVLSFYANSRIHYQPNIISKDGKKIYIDEKVIDISDIKHFIPIKTNISDLRTKDATETLKYKAISSDGNTAYLEYSGNLNKYQHSIKILDISNLKKIKELGEIILDHKVNNINISNDNNHIYFDIDNKLKIYDVSTPSTPIFISSIDIPENILFSRDKQKGYINKYPNIEVYDFSNLQNPKKIATLPIKISSSKFDISPDNTKLYIFQRGSKDNQIRPKLKIYDISNLTDIKEVGSLEINKHITYENDDDKYYRVITCIKISSDGTKAYIGAHSHNNINFGISIVDISNPITPTTIGYLRSFRLIYNLFESPNGDTLYVHGSSRFSRTGIFAVDIRNDSDK